LIVYSVSISASDSSSKETIDIILNLPKDFTAIVNVASESETIVLSHSSLKYSPELGEKHSFKKATRLRIECLDVHTGGTMFVKQTWEAFKRTQFYDGKEIRGYDTDDPLRPIPKEEFFEANLLGQNMIYEVKPDGTIVSVSGYEKIVKKMKKPALKYVHLGVDGIIRELKKLPLLGIAEVCSEGPIAIGELRIDNSIPNIESIIPIKEYSRTCELKEIRNNVAYFEISVRHIGQMEREIVDLEEKIESKSYVDHSGSKKVRCDINTGLIVKSLYKSETKRINKGTNNDKSPWEQRYVDNSITTIETNIVDKKSKLKLE
jgi:hypothetical protein